jgi:hypothetical protein
MDVVVRNEYLTERENPTARSRRHRSELAKKYPGSLAFSYPFTGNSF